MKKLLLTMTYVAFAMPSIASAQDEDEHGHSDVEFAYDGGKIEVEFGDEGPVFEGEFPIDGIDLQFTAEPGLASELDEGAGIVAGNQIVYNVHSDLMFWNDGFQSVPNNAQIRVINRPPAPLVPDTIIGVGTGDQLGRFDPALNRVGQAETDGDFHSDLDFFLEPKTDTADASMFGVYGFIVSLSTDEDGIANSDPFAMVFNFGLEEEVFEKGVEAFARTVPEPTSGTSMVVALVCGICFFRKRAIAATHKC